MKDTLPTRVRFGAFELDLKSGELHNGDQIIQLQDQPFKVLRILIERGGEIATREQIQKKLWPNNTVVEFDHSINAAIKNLRRVLGDSAAAPQYVETVGRHGYRFMVPVEWVPERPADAKRADYETGPQLQAPSGANLTGKRISHYRVLEILGGGGMGEVYKAEDLTLGRRVALKFLPEELTSDSIALERFRREARAASALNHPNVCTIHEIQEHDGHPFIAMELLEGATLRELIEKNTVPAHHQLDILVQVAKGLEAAHQKGVVHRDIKPANIFITIRGEAKILDFGVAMLVDAGRHRDDAAADGASANSQPVVPLNLTRTGVRTGTASYMSPEQIRGEKLDGRTDLFSFGLVIYELATGHRAFSGETATILHDAVLNSTAAPARALNPELPPTLENVIERALTKEREARYQTASEMRADLETAVAILSRRAQDDTVTSRRNVATRLVVAVVVLLSISGALYWFQQKPSIVRELKQWQLTANTDEDPVRHGQISPDGRYLAYCDLKGMHIQLVATGDLNDIPEPQAFADSGAYYTGLGWFPDSTKLFVNVSVPGQRDSIWTFSVTGGAPRKLRDDADASSVSPDGSAIVFSRKATRLGDSEIWLMEPGGSQARRLCEAGENSGFTSIAWSPDSRRLACIKNHWTPGQLETLLEIRDREGKPTATILSDTRLRNLCWLPDGRMIYSLADLDINGLSCNYWEMSVDPQTGERHGTPKRLTNWAAFGTDGTKATADGRWLAFKKWRVERSVYIADLELNGTRITTPRRLTHSAANEFPMAWTTDSKAVLFLSNRTGRWGILKQSLNAETAESIVKRTEDMAVPMPNFDLPDPVDLSSTSPDGAWVLYVVYAKQGGSSPLQLMRVPINGGSPHEVLKAPIYGQRCARLPATLCAIAEQTRDHKQLIFTSFDPVKGLGGELMRFDTDPNAEYEWDLSPDGTQIAVHKFRRGRIHVLSLSGQLAREISVNGWSRFEALHWAADGRGLLGCSRRQMSSVLLHVDLQGRIRVLGEHPGTLGNDAAGIRGIPSPDGRHLALMMFTLNSNMWVMEGF